jgi:hypothetical protein
MKMLTGDRVFLMAATSLGWALEVQAPLAAVLVVGFFMGLGTGTNNTGESRSWPSLGNLFAARLLGI